MPSTPSTPATPAIPPLPSATSAPHTPHTPHTPSPHHVPAPAPYRKPARTERVMSAFIGWLARRGVSLAGSAELSVRGRTSGEWRRVPVNPLEYDGATYLVSARGHSAWVRNMRAAGGGRLQVGRRTRTFSAAELPDARKPDILRAYLERWGWQVGRFFGEVTAESSDADLLAAASRHPVFRVTVSR